MSLVPDDREEGVDAKALDGLFVGLAPKNLTFRMAVPPQPDGGEVSTLMEDVKEMVGNRLRIELGVRVGRPLADERDTGHEEILLDIPDRTQPGHLGGAEVDVQFQPLER